MIPQFLWFFFLFSKLLVLILIYFIFCVDGLGGGMWGWEASNSHDVVCVVVCQVDQTKNHGKI